jgi:hypothetical protein
MEFSGCTPELTLEAHLRDERSPAWGLPVSQNSTVWAAGRERPAKRWVSTLFQASPAGWTARMPSTCWAPAAVGAAAFPRKEVIQPQLPLRLPCYDFTPITDSTFGRCLPYGLAHGLRVFPAFVV